MSYYSSVKASINANIKANNNQEITGYILNGVLNEMVDTLAMGYLFKGVATPSTNPGSPDQLIFYIATPGTYPYFGNQTVPDAATGFFKWDSSWHLETISTGVADGAITRAKLALSLAEDLFSTGYKFMGIATPTTDPGTPDQNVFYLADQSGTYTNFGSLQVNDFSVLKYDGSWTKEETGIMTNILNVVEQRIETYFEQLAPWAFKGTSSLPNPMYRDVAIFPQEAQGGLDVGLIRYGYVPSLDNYIMSPIFLLGDEGYTYNLTFSAGISTNTGRYPGLVFFDENYDYAGYNLANANPRTVSGTVSSSRKYVRLLMGNSRLLDVYIYDNNAGAYLFKGSEVNLASIQDKEAFKASQYWLPEWNPNSRGDWIGWNFGGSDNAQTAQRTSYGYPIYRQNGAGAASWSHSVSKVVEMPQTGVDIEFSCGIVDSGLMLRLLNPETKTATYYGASETPRTITAPSTYTHLQLYFLKENYADCYIKDATNNVILWEGSSSLE